MNKYFFLVLLIIFSLPGMSQEEHSPKKAEKLAKKAFKQEDFKAALDLYKEFLKHDSSNLEANYRLGICYFNTGRKAASIPHFDFVRKNRTQGQYSNAEYYIGKTYHHLHQFDKALEAYNAFNAQTGSASELQKEIAKNIRNCEVGIALKKHPVKCIIKNAGEQVNTKGQESSPVVTGDGKYLYFSTINASVHHGHHNKDGDLHPGDIHWVKDINGSFTTAFVLSFNTNSQYHDDPVFVTTDNSRLYFITVNPGKANDIYVSEHNGNDWSKPALLPEPFNSTANETGFCLSADGNTAYFSSDRPGGFGGQDLYVVRKNSNGKWGPAINLGPKINSSFSEEAPFLSSDGQTLFFSSDGMNSIGGFDLFKINLKDSVKAEPINLGFPINSAENDRQLRMYAHGYKGYFSSTRDGGVGLDDIYFLQIIDTTMSPAKYISTYVEEKLFEQGMIKPDTGSKLQDKIYFDFNASRIADYSFKRLDHVLLMLNTYPELKLEIQGYTDNKGSEEANHIVSQRRAKSVFAYFVSKGVSPERMRAVGYAAENPLSAGESEIDQAMNRRVEFKVLSPNDKLKSSEYTGKYLIVKGSFSNKANAIKARDKMASTGAKAKLIEPGEGNSLYRLVLAETNDYEEAGRLLEELRKTHGESIWLLSL
ncbi:MAG: OmpA family protein [Cytophagaceae bacterium]